VSHGLVIKDKHLASVIARTIWGINFGVLKQKPAPPIVEIFLPVKGSVVVREITPSITKKYSINSG
jgi:hypothetical protein